MCCLIRWIFILIFLLLFLWQWSRTYIFNRWCQQRSHADFKQYYTWSKWWGIFLESSYPFCFPPNVSTLINLAKYLSILLLCFWIICNLCFCLQILVPVPQYPLYSATISLLGGSLIPYYLEETANWGLDIANLHQSVTQARSQGLTVNIPHLLLLKVYE